MKFIFEDGDFVLGQASIIVLNKPYVKKYFFNSSEPFWYGRVKQSIAMMVEHHGDDLFYSLDISNKIITLTMNYIDHKTCDHKSYLENLENYLRLVDTFGFKKSKRDLQHYNLIYRKNDDEPFLIDWDSFTEFENEAAAYEFYKSQLCSYKWKKKYNMNQEEIEQQFNRLWKKL